MQLVRSQEISDVYKDEHSCWHYRVSDNDRSTARMGTGMRWTVLDGRARLWCAARMRRRERLCISSCCGVLWGHYVQGKPTDKIGRVFLIWADFAHEKSSRTYNIYWSWPDE